MTRLDAFYGPNAGYALELYDRYKSDPASVDEETRAFFDDFVVEGNGKPSSQILGSSLGADMSTSLNGAAHKEQLVPDNQQVSHIVAAARLARSIREYGHLAADIDPLGGSRPGDPMIECETHGLNDEVLAGLPASIVWPSRERQVGNCLDAIHELREVYCGHLGYDFDHVQDYAERIWLHEQVEAESFRDALKPEQRIELLRRLTEVEAFERFLHNVFQGQKRFSLEGNDVLVPMLDDIVDRAEESGVQEVLMGMAHRGRLNVLAHVLGKPYPAIFSEFHSAAKREGIGPSEGSAVLNAGWTGDVKYHLGARRTLRDGGHSQMQLTLADNPSHLEIVDPVVEGFTRAAQDVRDQPGAPKHEVDRALALTIHGDAAFPGEGVVAETLNLSRLAGYETGGTLRIIVNNQVGFTTLPEAGRSTLYASDLAKGFEIPVVHVNADDPEAALSAVSLAYAYRERFHKDFLIDLVGYRRWGHNEGDEPSFTQPRMYEKIRSHPNVRALYAEHLEREGVITANEADEMVHVVQGRLQKAREQEPVQLETDDERNGSPTQELASIDTSVPLNELRAINEALLARPDTLNPQPRLERLIDRRREALQREGGIDWALAETLAYATILAQGTPIRLTGQDTERGTFSQRHLTLHDIQTGNTFTPLQSIPQAKASFAVYNSPLSESAALGFEYGYTVHATDTLVMWEAQFGDFANVGQVVIDQFMAAARAKWRQQPALVLMLPHGYEGQGPEHSSARLERYLQLAAEDNMRIANCTTSAQYFHLLRLQAATLDDDRRPLVIMTPKSLLRHPLAASSATDLTDGRFQPVLDDLHASEHPNSVERIVLCSGKVAIDLLGADARKDGSGERVAIVRVELLYPFPKRQIEHILDQYPNAGELVWAQEEPRNMGAWNFMAAHLRSILPEGTDLAYVGRGERASTAEGSSEAHTDEQGRIISAVFDLSNRIETVSRGVQHVG